MTVFKVARERGAQLVRALELTPFSRTEFDRAYLPSDDPIEIARRVIVRSFQGFGSDGVHSSHRTGFRGRSQRSGTTPAHDWRNFPEKLWAIIERMRGVVIEHKPAMEVLQRYDGAQVLHYVDPPYLHSTRCRVDAQRGYRHELTNDEHVALADLLNGLRGSVVLSGYPSPLYLKLYSRWKRVERTGPFADGARTRTEVLWIRCRS